jgi:hypothetical protein
MYVDLRNARTKIRKKLDKEEGCTQRKDKNSEEIGQSIRNRIEEES